jgi:TonB family protein
LSELDQSGDVGTFNKKGPSFNCIAAKTWDEKAICSNQELAQLDLALSKAYRAQLMKIKNLDQQRMFVNNKLDWLRLRHLCHIEENKTGCLKNKMSSRIELIQDFNIMSLSKGKPNSPTKLPDADTLIKKVKERESIALPEQLVKLDLKKEVQSTSALMTELEAIEKMEVHPIDISVDGEQFERSDSFSAFKDIKGESFTSVVEKFQELEDSSPETSSVLSLYVGEVYKRVYSKWKTPFGSKFEDVAVSFTIFSKGNINNPVIRKSTGDKNLDSIAVRAVMAAVPFPALPEELHRPNLKVSIIFKYVPEKK